MNGWIDGRVTGGFATQTVDKKQYVLLFEMDLKYRRVGLHKSDFLLDGDGERRCNERRADINRIEIY